jgi:hypothetical protein
MKIFYQGDSLECRERVKCLNELWLSEKSKQQSRAFNAMRCVENDDNQDGDERYEPVKREDHARNEGHSEPRALKSKWSKYLNEKDEYESLY